MENLLLEQIEKSNKEENDKWIQAEKNNIEQWNKLQEERERLHQKHLEQVAKIKMVMYWKNFLLVLTSKKTTIDSYISFTKSM